MTAVILAMTRARSREPDVRTYPPTISVGLDENGECKPCPAAPPSYVAYSEGAGRHHSVGLHYHQYSYNQAPDCTCRLGNKPLCCGLGAIGAPC